jgi:6-pyruvoyltetrahydropterin/6-carboxytetrahydropterin synthase
MSKKYVSTKLYKEIGSVAYRQWRADSHCRLLHGYALSFYFEFESTTVDVRNWVVDYGSLGGLKENLKEWFDHTLLVAEDDPDRAVFENLQTLGLARVQLVEKTGCEGLADFLIEYVDAWLDENGYKTEDHYVKVRKVEVRETENNMAFVENQTELAAS